ncbi:hypothetical protein AGDE_15199 [Angomonas deanei]|nr:hypothetical protein AGDE_15199 [Angomonas deanei]|eukprot:EPY19538.1 hypothetical protein AGDE_15199 [Angomonas deanei]
MRGFVTDLLQARYMDDTPTIPRQKSRVGRRREAQFAKDKGGDQANPFKEVNSPGALLSKGENEKLYRMYQNSLKMSFDTFLANASMDEMAQYGHLFLKQAIRRSSVFPVVNMRDLQVNSESTVSILGALTRGEPAALQRANTIHSMCHNCTEVEQIRQIYLEGDPPQPLPHPKEGIVTYGNLAHHMSWAEITKVCSASEIQQYKTLWKECAIGVPKNMVRIENN